MRTILAVTAVTLAGCPDRTISVLSPDQVGEIQKDIPVSADIDILFVIDSSQSTEDKQTVFTANFPKFVEALDAFESGRPNVHIGVVTTSVDVGSGAAGGVCSTGADNGVLQSTPRVPGCAPPTGRFISDIKLPNGMRQTNYTDSLANTFSCIAQVGANGCGFEAPLEAARRALDGRHGQNAGFLRPGAFLAIVILTDEDDASIEDPEIFRLAPLPITDDFRAQPQFAYQCDRAISNTGPGTYTNCRVRTDSYLRDPGDYFATLAAIRPAARTVVALIGGDPKPDIATGTIESPPLPREQELALLPSCSAVINGREAIGRPAIRAMDFVSRYGDHGLFRSVCQDDYSQTLTDIGKLLFSALSPCLEGEVDTTDVDPTNPGTQLDCSVSDVEDADTPSEDEVRLPACDMTDANTPAATGDGCYWIRTNPAACTTTTTGLEINFVRRAPPAPGTTVRVRCATRGDD